jgi:hypothetical protein
MLWRALGIILSATVTLIGKLADYSAANYIQV